jgi:hypothetical protein
MSDDYVRARNTDPSTSHEAADKVGEFVHAHYYQILHALLDHGPLGKDGIAKVANMNGREDGNAVARRLPELLKQSLVSLTGEKVLSRSGRSEREWAINEAVYQERVKQNALRKQTPSL